MMQNHNKEIYLAGGCFWGTEAYLKGIHGVIRTEAGYVNGNKTPVSYREVCTGTTGHAEAVKVLYDDAVLSLPFLLELFFQSVDPTAVNRQGNDVGTQYRSGIYYTEDHDRIIIEESIDHLANLIKEPIAIEVKKLENYSAAEEMHQDYLEKNPGGYCHISPRLMEYAKQASLPTSSDEKKSFQKPSAAKLKETLSDLQYRVTQQNGTEPPFQNEYWDTFEDGIYVDITTGEPLFVSTDKFESHCGWPSFSKPITEDLLKEKLDLSYGIRTEVRSETGDAHLGHVFPDGPQERGGLRYCINSASLRFIPLECMEEEGYGAYINFIDKK